MRKFVIFSFPLLVLLWWSPGVCLARQPREGYVRTADGVRLFYKIVGSGPETLVAIHGGPSNPMESILHSVLELFCGKVAEDARAARREGRAGAGKDEILGVERRCGGQEQQRGRRVTMSQEKLNR